MNWQIYGATQANNDFMLWMARKFTLHKKRGMKLIGQKLEHQQPKKRCTK
jgi:hypothetical protein